MASVAAQGLARGSALLFGRRTYEDFYGFWPNQPQPNPFTDVLNRSRKYVASRTLSEPLPWENSTLLEGDAGESVAELKGSSEEDLVVLGSGDLIETLMRHDLIDEYTVLIHPLVLGTGRSLFVDGGPRATLQLVDSKITTTGVVIAVYRPDSPTR
jgi:dihydrofolate reductase